ncbi:MAG: hypothetical protein EPN97_14155 [Alphaproteobacteria bacterium]|nr:MAG: hypothetical protein EPN97_14155 [Alphaproteobacteria bacterium]
MRTSDQQQQELAGIDRLLSDFADELPQLVDTAWKSGFSSLFRSKEVQDSLRRKFKCSALCPHHFTDSMIRQLPGFRKLDAAARAPELDVAFTVAVCHFKPGPDAEGLYKVSNPEAVVVVHLNPDEAYAKSDIVLYEDKFKFRVCKPLTLTAPAARTTPAVMAPIKLKIR